MGTDHSYIYLFMGVDHSYIYLIMGTDQLYSLVHWYRSQLYLVIHGDRSQLYLLVHGYKSVMFTCSWDIDHIYIYLFTDHSYSYRSIIQINYTCSLVQITTIFTCL